MALPTNSWTKAYQMRMIDYDRKNPQHPTDYASTSGKKSPPTTPT